MKIVTSPNAGPDVEVEWTEDEWPVQISIGNQIGNLTRTEARGLAAWILGALEATEKEEED